MYKNYCSSYLITFINKANLFIILQSISQSIYYFMPVQIFMDQLTQECVEAVVTM